MPPRDPTPVSPFTPPSRYKDRRRIGDGDGGVAGSGSGSGARSDGDGDGGVAGSGSGSGAPSDGKQHSGEYIGVRNRGFAVEIRKWYEGVDFYKDVKMTEGEAAIVHDLARLYVNRDCKRLNIQELESRMQKEDPAKFNWPLHIGKEFLIGFVEKHPLTQVGRDAKERADSMKEEIIFLAPVAYKRLKEEIAREHSSRAGGQKKKVDEFPCLLQLSKEIQDLKATISAQNAAFEVKDAKITSLTEAIDAAQKGRDIVMEELYAAKQAARAASVTPFKPGVAEREEFPQNESNPASETWMEYVDWTTISCHHTTTRN